MHELIPRTNSVVRVNDRNTQFVARIRDQAPRFTTGRRYTNNANSFFRSRVSHINYGLRSCSTLIRRTRDVPQLSKHYTIFTGASVVRHRRRNISAPSVLLKLYCTVVRGCGTAVIQQLPIYGPIMFYNNIAYGSNIVQTVQSIFSLARRRLVIPRRTHFRTTVNTTYGTRNTFALTRLSTLLGSTVTAHSAAAKLPELRLLPNASLSRPGTANVLPRGNYTLNVSVNSADASLILIKPRNRLISFRCLHATNSPRKTIHGKLTDVQRQFNTIHFATINIANSKQRHINGHVNTSTIQSRVATRTGNTTR